MKSLRLTSLIGAELEDSSMNCIKGGLSGCSGKGKCTGTDGKSSSNFVMIAVKDTIVYPIDTILPPPKIDPPKPAK